MTFLDEIDWNDINSAEQYWDSSAADDGSVISYIKYNESQSTAAGADRYDLYIAGDGGVGALSMEVVVPDPEESLTLFERLINAIKAFFEKIAEFFSF